ncbi:acyl-coenzyme A thioesterase 1-like [Oratosquilla oratoria]|uniref:acyl-coenzyme A thioesterase 1-like n=1 Tax=Oratosquilla oratoria TaxID=337810 RepID=UPI003F773795
MLVVVTVLISRTMLTSRRKLLLAALQTLRRTPERGLNGQNRNATLSVSPRVCLHDVFTNIIVEGLEPGTPVTLRAAVRDDRMREVTSHAHYVASEKGTVKVSHDVSMGGSYTGVFPPGLLTTLRPAPGTFKYLRFTNKDVTSPIQVQFSLYEDHLPIEAHYPESSRSQPARPIASCWTERHLVGPGVRRIPVREGRIRGTLFLPPGPGPFPGVIDTFGGIGGLVETRSALLASRGFASLALAYFNYDDLPKTIGQFKLEYFEEAVEYLLAQPEVIPDRCGFISVSLSGFLGLACSSWMEKIKAVVTIGGLPFFAFARVTYKEKEYFGTSFDQRHLITMENGEVHARGHFSKFFEYEPSNVVPVEQADEETHFLMVGGEQDFWDCHKGLDVIQRRLSKHGRSDKLQTILYPGVGHIVEVPYSIHVLTSWQGDIWGNSKKQDGRAGFPTFWGGDPHSTCVAQVHLWNEMRSFLLHHVRDRSIWYQNLIEERVTTQKMHETQNLSERSRLE